MEKNKTYLEHLKEELNDLKREYFKGNRNFYFDPQMAMLQMDIRREENELKSR